jgi:RNA polymerase sigma-70 factor (ECF subfamily)
MIDDASDSMLERLRADGQSVLAEQFSLHRQRLWSTVKFRLDRRLVGRVDADDVLQEAYLDALTRVDHYLNNPEVSLFVWLRSIVAQTLIDVHRRHLGTQMRDAAREIALRGPYTQATSITLAEHLLGRFTSPSQAALRDEQARQIQEALAQMNEIDQEVVALRHFEELTNKEVAEVLGIKQKAASIRYVRALARLKVFLVAAGPLGDPASATSAH